MTEEGQEQQTQDTETTETQETNTSQEGAEQTKATDGESLLGKKNDQEGETKSEGVELPEAYEFNMPEGRELDKGMVDRFTPVLKELKIGQDGAQKLASLLVEDQIAKEKAYAEITEGWKQETIKTLGTDYQSKLASASKFIDKFGSDEVRKVLNDTGLGNHPQIVQMFINAGKHFGNDSFVAGTTKKNAVTDPEREARKMFPNTKFD
jgi:hypothetical protein